MLLQTAVILLCGFTVSSVAGSRYSCVHLTEEDVARHKAQMKVDKPKVAELVRRIKEPEEYDFRKEHPEYLTPVADQGNCSSCWAFAFAGLLESRYAAQHKTNAEQLSKSELVECASHSQHDNKCDDGGLFEYAYDYTEKYGLLSEQEYPYKNSNGTSEPCKRSEFGYNQTRIVKPVSKLRLGTANETKSLLYKYGPIYVYVNSNLLQNSTNFDIIRKDDVECCPGWSFVCPQNWIDHAVLLVGYGVENDVPYWIIRNSWGTERGEGGFHRMERGSNTCGIEKFNFHVVTN